jgi:hypothetical protein
MHQAEQYNAFGEVIKDYAPGVLVTCSDDVHVMRLKGRC